MSEKLYTENYPNYQHPSCAKQIQQIDSQAFFPYPSVPLNTFSPTTNLMDFYNIPSQTVSRNQQNNCLPANVYQEQTDFLSWENRVLPDVEKTLKIPDKMEMIEINSKDLSPASYCSNIDLLTLPDCYKPSGKEVNYQTKYDNQWCYSQSNCNQKNFEYPSCAQEKSIKYCGVQKNSDLDSIIKSYALNNDMFSDGNDTFYKGGNRTSSNDVLLEYNAYNYYEGKFTENQVIVQNDNYFNTTNIHFEPVINSIDQQTEGSNEESDIIVEESDEEVTDYSEDQEKRLYCQSNKCLICNVVYTPLGFIKVSDYKSHMVSHSTDKKYSCTKCEKSYKTLSNLNFHMKMHNEQLPFSCDICKKGFMRKEYLEAHVNNHKGLKNFGCTICDKKFVSQKNLDSHFKYHEGTVKKNSCNICGKTFSKGFEEHLRVHNNLREFECEHCDMKFNTKGSLSKHVKKKHMDVNSEG
ncbi:hypothetical protein NQ318_009267 [Aromia moschata]|uniref:C2H2-type domain-containing protein n=1 Tax=Aromia moschata TaxID=1265417 RepID=A0AAV8YKW5_9CUCU|nr:hypothetical protein NQ318_009267 [Aromia moschata]